MIRINLLSAGPKARAAKPQYDVRAQVMLAVGVILIVLAGCWWYSAALDDEIEMLQSEKQGKETQIAQLQQRVKKFKTLSKRRNCLRRKIGLLNNWNDQGSDQ